MIFFENFSFIMFPIFVCSFATRNFVKRILNKTHTAAHLSSVGILPTLQSTSPFCRNISSARALTTRRTTPSAAARRAAPCATSTPCCRWTSRWPWCSASPSSSPASPPPPRWWSAASGAGVRCTTPAAAATPAPPPGTCPASTRAATRTSSHPGSAARGQPTSWCLHSIQSPQEHLKEILISKARPAMAIIFGVYANGK